MQGRTVTHTCLYFYINGISTTTPFNEIFPTVQANTDPSSIPDAPLDDEHVHVGNEVDKLLVQGRKNGGVKGVLKVSHYWGNWRKDSSMAIDNCTTATSRSMCVHGATSYRRPARA